jgi:group II intron reverse transcriptase/maturase
MKRSPEKVLNSLTEHSVNLDYKFERLYRILFNEEMYYVAYQRIYAKPGNMTAGSDGKTIDQTSLTRFEKLIASLKDESYQPQPSRRVYIPKKNGKIRPLGVPAFDDKLLQEVIRMILEAIYEGQFENTSHGFRPKRSCHTALTQVKETFSGVKWFVEGDIKGFFDNINHEVMINTLKERIADDRFIRLIRKFLNAGFVENWKFHNSYSGTPQGGIVSPILANIYLDKLDKYMKEYTEKFDKGKNRKGCKQWKKLQYKRKCILSKLEVVEDITQKTELIKQLKANQKENTNIPSGEEMDTNYKRLKYVRYADDFLIGKKMLEHGALEIKIHNGKEQWKPMYRPKLVCRGDLEILDKYNKEIRGLYNYFSLAINCSVLSKFAYIMRCSMHRTFAHKYRTKVTQIVKKYKRNGHFSVRYQLSNGMVKDLTFYHDGFRKKDPVRFMDIDNLPVLNKYHVIATKLANRLKAEKCEMCGAAGKLAMHHVRKLKDLKGKTPLKKRMIACKRKSIALCSNCLKLTHQK